jgi:hypothetical protein
VQRAAHERCFAKDKPNMESLVRSVGDPSISKCVVFFRRQHFNCDGYFDGLHEHDFFFPGDIYWDVRIGDPIFADRSNFPTQRRKLCFRDSKKGQQNKNLPNVLG